MRTLINANQERQALTAAIESIADRKALFAIRAEIGEFAESKKWAVAPLIVWEQYPNGPENRYAKLNNTKIVEVELIRQATSDWAGAPAFFRDGRIGFIFDADL